MTGNFCSAIRTSLARDTASPLRPGCGMSVKHVAAGDELIVDDVVLRHHANGASGVRVLLVGPKLYVARHLQRCHADYESIAMERNAGRVLLTGRTDGR